MYVQHVLHVVVKRSVMIVISLWDVNHRFWSRGVQDEAPLFQVHLLDALEEITEERYVRLTALKRARRR